VGSFSSARQAQENCRFRTMSHVASTTSDGSYFTFLRKEGSNFQRRCLPALPDTCARSLRSPSCVQTRPREVVKDNSAIRGSRDYCTVMRVETQLANPACTRVLITSRPEDGIKPIFPKALSVDILDMNDAKQPKRQKACCSGQLLHTGSSIALLVSTLP
jgi:hypothetical protein